MKKLILLPVLMMFFSCDLLMIKPSVKKECGFILPTDWKLSQNKAGKWAVINKDSWVLGYSVRYKDYGFAPYDNNSAMTFDDSCSAKGLAKQYFDFVEENKFK